MLKLYARKAVAPLAIGDVIAVDCDPSITPNYLMSAIRDGILSGSEPTPEEIASQEIASLSSEEAEARAELQRAKAKRKAAQDKAETAKRMMDEAEKEVDLAKTKVEAIKSGDIGVDIIDSAPGDSEPDIIDSEPDIETDVLDLSVDQLTAFGVKASDVVDLKDAGVETLGQLAEKVEAGTLANDVKGVGKSTAKKLADALGAFLAAFEDDESGDSDSGSLLGE